jgi:hypothetical protein
MLRLSGNSIHAVIPVTVYLQNGPNDTIQFVDISNTVVENPKLQTVVMIDIQYVGGIAALGTSKRYFVEGITYAVDFTRYT